MAGTRSKGLKVGFVLDDGLDNPDGVQQYILAVGDWLRSKGHQVSYLVGQTSREDIPGVHSMSRNVRVRFNGNQGGTMPLPASTRKIRQVLEAGRFDVLHVQVPYSPFMGSKVIMNADGRTAVIGTFHIAPNNRLVALGNRALGIRLKKSLRRIDTMLSVSQAAADFASDTFRVDSTISPNVIDYGRFHAAKPLKEYDDERLTILFLGRLVPRKGCLQLLKAVNLLADRGDLPGFRVIICGTGPLENHLRRYITEHRLNGIVEMAGFVTEEDKPRYYASADISVFPSTGGESFGIVLLEAMASGRSAILAGDNEGYRSVLVSRPELLVDADDARGMAVSLAHYLQDGKFRREVSRWGADFTRSFDVNVVGERLVGIYEEALHKRRNR
ncbi:MAG TPA: glycosyltransferase family 4 protein [Candidatus Saccharimonadales bacterium]|nr:glycosyltransferase family 4 protein [Candidatus Saccharimonadales bacterium]